MFCVWLLPTDEQSTVIAEVISSNMALLNRPHFLPHMTLFDSTQALNEKCQEHFAAIVDVINSNHKELLTLKIASCTLGQQFYKSFYCEIEDTKALRFIYNQVRNLDTASKYTLLPHVSLAYGNSDKKQLRTLNFKTITFDKICLVADNNEESNEAISRWEVIKSYKLG